MRLSHKKKLAHKRSGAAKGRRKVFLCRQIARDVAADLVNKVSGICQCNVLDTVVNDERLKRSMLLYVAHLICAPFRRLREAGAAQADIIRGHLW